MEALTPVMMVDMVSTVVIPGTQTESRLNKGVGSQNPFLKTYENEVVVNWSLDKV